MACVALSHNAHASVRSLTLPAVDIAAALQADAAWLQRRLQGDALPKVKVCLKNVTANPKKLASYRQVCGFPVSGSMPVIVIGSKSLIGS